METRQHAAIVTVGSELTEGLRIDTNTAEIARTVSRRGFTVAEAVSVGDDAQVLASALSRLTAAYELVITTGGLGPTHDDITRDAASLALGVPLSVDDDLAEGLRDVQHRHTDPAAVSAVLNQALVLEGADILPATTGTAPGQVIETSRGRLALLPGPPSEMLPMLAAVCELYPCVKAEPVELGVTGMPESDVQHAAQRALSAFDSIVLTVLAKPGDVRVLLVDDGAGSDVLERAGHAVAEEIGAACYALDGRTLAQATLDACRTKSLTVATAESCTGGLVSAALTDVPGSSEVFLGGVVSYADSVKAGLLGVPETTLARFGAVSEETAVAMAEGVRRATGADIAVSVTGIAGPGGGSAEKPVGLVWFAVATSAGTETTSRSFARGGREAIRARSAATALDLVRRTALG